MFHIEFLHNLRRPPGRNHDIQHCRLILIPSNHHPQVDTLSTLPEDVLCRIFRILSKQHVTGVLSEHPMPLEAHTPAYQALRLCCKWLRSVSDNYRPSISFHARDQEHVEPFLRKLPQLRAVSIKYCNKSCIYRSLQSLFAVLPQLTSLSLQLLDKIPLCGRVETNIGSALVLWSRSLQRVTLNNILCLNSVTGFNSGLGFVSDLPFLTHLELHSVSPVLTTKDVAGCSRLQSLILSGNSREAALDLSPCTSLTELRITDYSLKQLHVSGLTALQRLDCSNNIVSELDTSTCTALTQLNCRSNLLSSLDVTSNQKIRVLKCGSNPLTALRVTGCPVLMDVMCNNSSFTELELAGCSSLHKLYLTGSQVHALDLTACPNLGYLGVGGSQHLLTLNLSGLTKLRRVILDHSTILAWLDVTGCSALDSLSCAGSPALTAVRLTGCSALHALSLRGCQQMRFLNLTGCERLRRLDCSDCPLASLDLSPCRELEEVTCGRTKIKTLDATSAAASLFKLSCDSCPHLEALRLTHCAKLASLSCSWCPQLLQLSCFGCDSLVRLSLKQSGRFDGMTIVALRAGDRGV